MELLKYVNLYVFSLNTKVFILFMGVLYLLSFEGALSILTVHVVDMLRFQKYELGFVVWISSKY